jgi:hypothetical protein
MRDKHKMHPLFSHVYELARALTENKELAELHRKNDSPLIMNIFGLTKGCLPRSAKNLRRGSK